MLLEVAVDGGLEVDDALEDAALQPSAGQFGKEALDGVEPGGGGWGEVEGPSGVALQPSPDLGMLVGGVVIQDGVDDLPGRDIPLDGVEEADEFLVAMLLHASPDHRAVQDV